MIDASAPVEVFDEIDSTILEARRRAERGETGPVWLIARRQTAGRGRRGRAWASLEGNLLATYLFATDQAAAEITGCEHRGGAVLAEGAGDGVGIGAAVDDLDRVGDLARLGEHLECDGCDLALGGFAEHPDLVQTHFRFP